ncbi:hypothetical protein CYMTET_36076 [Cymbomonas tetramitiformis]|uniref:Uncharacterized protein n=1 Tax=Cymbomonas tetramitiformis TaxID=36881 RepID=A0AAE0KN98_9CHLO|nr:hypothetical protein CYMTET_36076 [Cymbomonas tetramitiformis]
MWHVDIPLIHVCTIRAPLKGNCWHAAPSASTGQFCSERQCPPPGAQVRHREKIIEVYNTVGPLAHLRKEPPFLELPWTQKKRKLHRLARRLSSATKRNIKWGLKAHPLTAIGLVGATEPFSRSERVLIQANTFVMMLLFTVWFYYSKAVNCCQDFRAVISCPRERDVEEPCFGFPSGVALREGADEGLLPEEVQAMDFTCNAFPQSTFTGKVWVIVIIVGILTPMTMILSQLFIMASNATIPANWGTYAPPALPCPLDCHATPCARMDAVVCARERTKKSEKLFGRTLTAVVQTIFLMCYAVFFNFQKFNKAMAVTLVSLLGILINARYVRAVIQAFVEAYKRLLHWWAWASARLAAAVRAQQQPSGAEQSEEEKVLESVRMASPIEVHLQKLAYCLILAAWMMCTWSLLIFSRTIRAVMGAEEEREIVSMWAITLAVEMFGQQSIQIIALRIFVDAAMLRIERFFTDQDHPAFPWFESYIISVMDTGTSSGKEDTGEQDMGDDADADGGGDDEMDVACDDSAMMMLDLALDDPLVEEELAPRRLHLDLHLAHAGLREYFFGGFVARSQKFADLRHPSLPFPWGLLVGGPIAVRGSDSSARLHQGLSTIAGQVNDASFASVAASFTSVFFSSASASSLYPRKGGSAKCSAHAVALTAAEVEEERRGLRAFSHGFAACMPVIFQRTQNAATLSIAQVGLGGKVGTLVTKTIPAGTLRTVVALSWTGKVGDACEFPPWEQMKAEVLKKNVKKLQGTVKNKKENELLAGAKKAKLWPASFSPGHVPSGRAARTAATYAVLMVSA